MAKEKDHLPVIGVGPVIVIPQLILTAAGLVMSVFSMIPKAGMGIFRIPCCIAGILLIILAVYLWISANFREKIDEGIRGNHLITTGVYSMTRNPIYSAFFLICAGSVLIADNLILSAIPLICWLYMTAFLKRTEEKWLLDLYGDEYRAYCRKVNRIIPWKIKSENRC